MTTDTPKEVTVANEVYEIIAKYTKDYNITVEKSWKESDAVVSVTSIKTGERFIKVVPYKPSIEEITEEVNRRYNMNYNYPSGNAVQCAGVYPSKGY